MRAGVHMALTIGLTVVSAVGSLVVYVLVLLYGWNHDWPRPAVWSTLLIPFCGLHLPGWLMRPVPCVCPTCGGKAQLEVAATTLSIIPSPKYAWSCTACNWSSYYWSPYQ